MEAHRSVVDVIEESLGEALDADFIADLDRLSIDDLENLKAGYDAFAHDYAAPRPAAGEFWPVSHRLIPLSDLENSQAIADIAAQKAMSQLLYAHGAIVPDRLGSLLADALNPRTDRSERPQWETHNAFMKADLANYLEVLAFLRPLVDAGLLVLRPRAVRGLGFAPLGGYFCTDASSWFDESELSAIEFEFGRDVRLKYQEERDKALREEGYFHGGSLPRAQDSDQRSAMTTAFEFLFRKFTDSANGLPGHLNLESRQEGEVFTWLLEQGLPLPATHPETENLSIIDSLTVPSLSDLQPADVIAMHQSDVWLEYRLALRRGLDRVRGLGEVPRAEALGIVREEMQAIQQAAAKTRGRSKFVEARANASRDLVVGAVVAASVAPISGPSSAAVGLTAATARTVGVLLWSWLCSENENNEGAIVRCFGALG